MEIFHISAECYPVAKVGGLADVVGALPKYQKKMGHDVKVVIPGYNTKFKNNNQFDICYQNSVKLENFNFEFTVLKEKTNKLSFELFLIEIPELFDRNEIYGFKDDIERFVAFQIAFLDWINSKLKMPDVINCHDHHAGLIPFMMQYCHKYRKLCNVATVITIHNGIYKGQFGFEKMNYLPQFDEKHIPILEWDNCINSLAVAVKCASAVTTVSPNYMNEINNFCYGLEPLFNLVQYKSKGILNGIDIEVWNPAKDIRLATNYSTTNFIKGKQANKDKLCGLYNLDASKPLFSFIGRLLEEKGGDLLFEASKEALSTHKNEINIFILGSGNANIEKQLTDLVLDFKGNYNVFIGYNEDLAHLIYAASDFLLMPSRVEPCGLNQMYALKYGTIPIVRRTGGLEDTVIDIGDGGNGICHVQASVVDICLSIDRAIVLFKNKLVFNKTRKIGMNTDHSWERVCQEYIETYQQIRNKL